MLQSGLYPSSCWLQSPDRGTLIAHDPGGAPCSPSSYSMHATPSYVHIPRCSQDGTFNMWSHGGTAPSCLPRDLPCSSACCSTFPYPSPYASTYYSPIAPPSVTPYPTYGYLFPTDAWPYQHPSAPAWPVHSQVEQKALLGCCSHPHDIRTWDAGCKSNTDGSCRQPMYSNRVSALPFLDPAIKSASVAPQLQGEVQPVVDEGLQTDGHLDITPSVVRAIEDDRLIWDSQLFVTDARGQVPPLTSTRFTVEDQGNSSPRFIRCTTYTLPATPQLAELSHLPLAAVVKPLARLPRTEVSPPLAEGVAGGPIQCSMCGAYVCPFTRFVEAGQRFRCTFCTSLSEVPWQYYLPTDHEGRRTDHQNRPELCRGSYEFLLADSSDTGSAPPAFLFLIDVSQGAVKSGLLQVVCDELKAQLCPMSSDSGGTVGLLQTRVGVITYDRTVHFYNLSACLSQPQMLVLTDLTDVEVPLKEGLIVYPGESRDMLLSLLDGIPGLFACTDETEAVFTPAIRAGLEALKVCGCPGKIFMFHASLFTADRKLQPDLSSQPSLSSKDKTIFHPLDTVSEKLGIDCAHQGCAVDLFLCPPKPCSDMATLGHIPLATCGKLHNYSEFQVETDSQRLRHDLLHGMEKPMGFSAQVKIFTSKGLLVSGFMNPSGVNGNGDFKMAYIDCDQSYMVEFKLDAKVNTEEGVYLQCALYYTSLTGQKKLRLHNIHLNCSERLVEAFQQSQAEALLCYFSKSAYSAILHTLLKDVRDALVSRLTRILACYRQQCTASCMSDGQMVMPQFLKALPVCLNALRKSEVLLPGMLTTVDERVWLRQAVLSMDVTESSIHYYPRILPLHLLQSGGTCLPAAVRCTEKALSPSGIYLAENRLIFFLWVGPRADPNAIQNILGVPGFLAVSCGACVLPMLDNPFSAQARRIIATLQKQGAHTAKLFVVKPGDETEKLFRMLLTEDKSPNGGASYKDFLCHIHLSIQQLLSQ